MDIISVERLRDTGRFGEALRATRDLPSALRRSPSVAALEADLLVETGELIDGMSIALRLSTQASDQYVRACALKVLGQGAFYCGRSSESRKWLQLAADIAAKLNPADPQLHASILLVRWRLFSRSDSDASSSDFDAARRAALKAASPTRLAELRISVAEDEARKSSPHEALRHLAHAARLLEQAPNVWLEGMAHNHTSNVFGILGDLENATEYANRAVACANVSGHFRTRVAAQINLAELRIATGRLAEGEHFLRDVLNNVGGHLHLHAAALDAASRLHIAQGKFPEAKTRLHEIVRLRRRYDSVATDWDCLSEWFSRAQLFEVAGQTQRAMHLLSRGIRRASEVGDRVWETKMRLRLARLRAADPNLNASNDILDVIARSCESAETLSEVALARADAEASRGATTVALKLRRRGIRIAKALGRTGGFEPNRVSTNISNEERAAQNLTEVFLDDAVALIELAGYPHVLARETYALLEISGAATAQALVARGPHGIRCVTAAGWTETEALAAAADPGDRLRIACGMHRDETWEVVADLRPTLPERCAAVAIRKLVDTAVTLDKYRREEKQRAALWPADTLETDGGLWVSEQMTELLAIARRIAASDITVLLTGETGTGKEVLARAIHRASPRSARPFVPFNCTAVPREMLDSQLFGYRKGAFTGANDAFEGIIRGAAGGTLFLDEIAEIGPELQPKLLRFLETHEVHGLGESQPVKVDVRVVAATNADLDALVADGRFREDLFYRLNVVRLKLPPLRERREEIPPLIDHYLRTAAEEQKKGRLTLDDETLEYLVLYAWPGNVRQLVNEIRRIVAYADADGTITPALLSPEIQASRRTVRVQPGEQPEVRVRLDQPLNEAIDAIERVMVVRALERAHGNFENAASLLGISRKGLFLKRRRWGMPRVGVPT